MRKTVFVNLGILVGTRARFNLVKAQEEAQRGESVTADELLNLLMDVYQETAEHEKLTHVTPSG